MAFGCFVTTIVNKKPFRVNGRALAKRIGNYRPGGGGPWPRAPGCCGGICTKLI